MTFDVNKIIEESVKSVIDEGNEEQDILSENLESENLDEDDGFGEMYESSLSYFKGKYGESSSKK